MGQLLTVLKETLLKGIGALFPIIDRNLDDKCVYQILRGEGNYLLVLRGWAENRLLEAMQDINPGFVPGFTASNLYRKVGNNTIPHDKYARALEATILDPRAPCRTLAWVLLSFDDVTVEEFGDLIKVAERLDTQSEILDQPIRGHWSSMGSYRFKETFGFDYIDSRMWKNVQARCEAKEGVV